MILFMILLFILLLLAIIVISTVSVVGVTGIILFGDVIVCGFLIVWIMKKLLKKKKRG